MRGLSSAKDVTELCSQVKDILSDSGLEIHPFLVGWYNEQVDVKFRLNYDPDTLAMVVISQPEMFEQSFLPFLATARQSEGSIRDPLDECMLHFFSKVTREIPETEALHDFQLGPTRRPRVLVQTAGHVAGAVRYYKSSMYPDLKSEEGSKIFSVCHHPTLGGWFALRGVFIFKDIFVEKDGLERREPSSQLSDSEAKKLLELYNNHWQDWRWRDVGRSGSSPRYSNLQKQYFETLPADRFTLINNVLDNTSNSCPN